MPDESRKSWHEDYARFFESPTRVALRNLLVRHAGEYDHIDFKSEWPEFSKVARHVLAMANTHGGVIVLGVEDTTDVPTGLTKPKDESEVRQALSSYLPDRLVYEMLDFRYTDSEYSLLKGKSFQVVVVEDMSDRVPFAATGDGASIKSGDIYVRRGTQSVKASYSELQDILNRRLELSSSTRKEIDLGEHIAQLKILYLNSPAVVGYQSKVFGSIGSAVMRALGGEPLYNPHHPEESFDAFVGRMVSLKKRRIEIELDVCGLGDREQRSPSPSGGSEVQL